MKQVLGISTAFILLLVSAAFIATQPQDRRGRRESDRVINLDGNWNRSELTDLSGTYTGTFQCSIISGGGESTLTITGNEFTLTPMSGGASLSGRITAVTTRGYTAVAMQFGESTAPPPGGTSTPPTIISLRARRDGDRLTLTSVGKGTGDCSFTPGGGGSGTGGRRRRRGGGGFIYENQNGNANLGNTTVDGNWGRGNRRLGNRTRDGNSGFGRNRNRPR